ncbi:MAG: hypothetical protein ACTSRS_18955 [Candidatus Helarchaeota archaeon]
MSDWDRIERGELDAIVFCHKQENYVNIYFILDNVKVQLQTELHYLDDVLNEFDLKSVELVAC